MCKRILPETKHRGTWRKQHGTTLIEVLVTALILGVGVMGMFKLQSYSLVLSRVNVQRQTAAWLMVDLSERVRIDSVAYRQLDNDFLNELPTQATTCRSGAHCTREQFAQQQMIDWKNSVAVLLPNADVVINRMSMPDLVSWSVSLGWFSDAGATLTGRIVL